MSDKPVWEENWRASLDHIEIDIGDGDAQYTDRVADVYMLYPDDSGEESFARARLAAAAPDMARALLAVQWACLETDLGSIQACPVCGAPHDPHKPDCALAAALRKAGVLP